MRIHLSLRVSILLSAALIAPMSLVPLDARASSDRPPAKAAWDSADVTRDGVVDGKDVHFVAHHLGERCTAKRRAVPGDLNRDCRVDWLDLAYVLREARKAHRAPANSAPLPKPDVASTSEDTPISIAVLANDVDPNGDALSLVSVGAGRLGTTAILPGGGVMYVPARDANGTDTFTYTVADTHGLTASQTVTVTIAPVNDAPAVTASASFGPAPSEVTFSAVGTDVDGDALTYAWSFGDGHSGQGPNIAHTYAGSGQFVATVVVSDGVATAAASVGVSIAPASRPSAYVVDTVAGTGLFGREGEGGPATSAQLTDPRQVVQAPDGSFYVADALRIVRVDAGGQLTAVRTFADAGFSDEGPSIALGPDGAVYYTDADILGYCGERGRYAEVRVRRLSPSAAEDPVVATWVNQNLRGSCSPSVKLAIDGGGSFYLGAANYVAKILPGSTGEAAWGQAVVDFAYALAGDPAGGVFVGGFGSILRIAADGAATPFAGNGTHGSTGDGGSALVAQVGTVSGLTVCPDGTVTFLEFDQTSFTPRIREVTPDSRIATIGGGTSGFNGDGRLALDTAFSFSRSAGIASLPDGGFYVADRENARVRRLLPAPAEQQK
jgi:VCBS repeat-containing protein